MPQAIFGARPRVVKAGKGADTASATTVVVGTDGKFFDVTGTTTITAVTVAAGTFFMLQFDGALTLTHSATDLILPGGANITTAAGDTLIAFAHAANKITVLNYKSTHATGIGGGPGSVQVFTTTGTWTKPAGCRRATIEVVGGGGGGGGASATSAGEAASGAGGGAGGRSVKYALDVTGVTTASITIGAAGAAASASTGGAGGDSIYDDTDGGGATTITAKGGGGGANGGNTGGNSFANGGLGGVAGTGGDINAPGMPGANASQSAATTAQSSTGTGGSTLYGGGGRGVNNNTGEAASGNGGGGGAASSAASQGARSGGVGTKGIIIVYEFY